MRLEAQCRKRILIGTKPKRAAEAEAAAAAARATLPDWLTQTTE